MQDPTYSDNYRISIARMGMSHVQNDGILKYTTWYAMAHTSHVTAFEVDKIETSKSPMDEWCNQMDRAA